MKRNFAGTRLLLAILYGAAAIEASERIFSVNDDVFAFPQYEVVFDRTWIAERDALKLLAQQRSSPEASTGIAPPHQDSPDSQSETSPFDSEYESASYERLIIHGQPHLCSIPQIDLQARNETSHAQSKADQEKELARATDRGLELLSELDGKCIYHNSGWWSYAFCYNSQIKQFHYLPPGSGGREWPPQEDPTTPAYILGRFDDKEKSRKAKSTANKPGTEVATLQTQGDSRYLVQRLGGGTTCDLTGKERRVEVQFHCHPSSGDRIYSINEVSTCSYLLVVYTPRLCNDVAFQPPQENKPHSIICKEILKPDEVHDWEEEKMRQNTELLTKERPSIPLTVGNIVIGAKKFVGGEGKRIEKGRIVKTPEEKAEVVARREGSKFHQLSKADLKRIEMDEDTLEALKQEIEELAGSKDWRLEIIDEPNGYRQIRGIVEAEEDQVPQQQGQKPKQEEEMHKAGKEEQQVEKDESSEETYKEDL
ncbi:MAG: hypothetical protein Q9227_003631 [Pyrenula ochraceoflavens]